MVRIIRSLALTAAILTAGVAAITMTPTAANASPVGGPAGAKETVKGNDVAIYPVTLKGGEATNVGLKSNDGGTLVLGLFDENKNLIEKRTVSGGEIGIITHTPDSSGKFFIAVMNPGDDAASFTVVAN